MRVDKSVIVLFRQMNLFLNRELLDEKLTSSDVLYLALLYEQDGRTQDERRRRTRWIAPRRPAACRAWRRKGLCGGKWIRSTDGFGGCI